MFFCPAVGYALFTSCRSALFYPLWVRSSGFFSSGSSICSCLPYLLSWAVVLYSLPGVAVYECVSLAPRAPYTPPVAVWCLGLSRACVVLRSSWHSMSRSPWHSMAFQRRFPTSSSPVHVLTHVFSSERFFACCVWLRVVWLYPTPLAPLPSARCACRGRCLQSCASPGTPHFAIRYR